MHAHTCEHKRIHPHTHIHNTNCLSTENLSYPSNWTYDTLFYKHILFIKYHGCTVYSTYISRHLGMVNCVVETREIPATFLPKLGTREEQTSKNRPHICKCTHTLCMQSPLLRPPLLAGQVAVSGSWSELVIDSCRELSPASLGDLGL